jgi:hypothetical protein
MSLVTRTKSPTEIQIQKQVTDNEPRVQKMRLTAKSSRNTTKQKFEKIQYISQDGEFEIREVIIVWETKKTKCLCIETNDYEVDILRYIRDRSDQIQFVRNMTKLIKTFETISFQPEDAFINYKQIKPEENMKSEVSSQTEHWQEPFRANDDKFGANNQYRIRNRQQEIR